MLQVLSEMRLAQRKGKFDPHASVALMGQVKSLSNAIALCLTPVKGLQTDP